MLRLKNKLKIQLFVDGVQFQGESAITARDLMIQEQLTNLLGTCLGWLMDTIYMGRP